MSGKQNQYNVGLDKTPANYVPLSPLSFLARSAAVSDRARRRGPRGPLCHDHYPGDGYRIIRAAVWSRLLCRLRHWPRRSRRGDLADLGLLAGFAGGADRGGDLPVDIDRIPLKQ